MEKRLFQRLAWDVVEFVLADKTSNLEHSLLLEENCLFFSSLSFVVELYEGDGFDSEVVELADEMELSIISFEFEVEGFVTSEIKVKAELGNFCALSIVQKKAESHVGVRKRLLVIFCDGLLVLKGEDRFVKVEDSNSLLLKKVHKPKFSCAINHQSDWILDIDGSDWFHGLGVDGSLPCHVDEEDLVTFLIGFTDGNHVLCINN